MAHTDPRLVALARRLRERYPVRMDEPPGRMAEVICTGATILVEGVTDESSPPTARTTSTWRCCAPSASGRS